MVQHGFFTPEEMEAKPILQECYKCKLDLDCISPKMKMTGEGKKKILIVDEAPGMQEDEKGTHFIGQYGLLLRKALEQNEIDLDNDCWKTNAVCCRPPRNRKPTKKEIKCCRPYLNRVIEETKPSIILLLGGIALDSFLGSKFSGASGGINKWRGFAIPDQSTQSWIIPTYHPKVLCSSQKYILKTKGAPFDYFFEGDILTALKKLNKKVPIHKDYNIIYSDRILDSNLQNLMAFDYETNSLSSYGEGKKIICCAISMKINEGYVFKVTSKNKKKLKAILENPKIKKTAHNMKFEHQWSKNVLKATVKGWRWDSMLAAHILDNRSGITGLKFLSYVFFGQEDYSSHLDKYIKSNDENGMNRIEDADINSVMKYCAMDAILQFKLAQLQMKEIEDER